jgi:hypothetical protein
MPLLNIDLMTPDGILFEGNEIPDDLQSGELISRLVNTLSLPRTTATGEVIKYSLEIVNQGVRLQSGQTLGEAGATNGDVIRLQSSHRIQKPSGLTPPQTPVVTQVSSLNETRPASAPGGAVIIIPIRGPNASVTKILGRLNDSLGIKPEEVSVLKHTTSNLNSSVSAALRTSRPKAPGKFEKYRTATLAGIAGISVLFLMLAVSVRKKEDSIAQSKSPAPAAVSIPTPTPDPTPEPTPEPTLEPTPEPTPEPIQETIARQFSAPAPKTMVNVPKGLKTEQPKSARAIMPQTTPVKLPDPPKPASLLAAQSAPAAMPQMSNTMPKAVAQGESYEMPEAPPRKCGMLHKVLAGCKNKQSTRAPRGGVAGVAGSTAESKAQSTISQGVGKAIPLP